METNRVVKLLEGSISHQELEGGLERRSPRRKTIGSLMQENDRRSYESGTQILDCVGGTVQRLVSYNELRRSVYIVSQSVRGGITLVHQGDIGTYRFFRVREEIRPSIGAGDEFWQVVQHEKDFLPESSPSRLLAAPFPADDNEYGVTFDSSGDREIETCTRLLSHGRRVAGAKTPTLFPAYPASSSAAGWEDAKGPHQQVVWEHENFYPAAYPIKQRGLER